MRYNQGDFGHIVYGEGEYYHDYIHGFYDVMKWRHGKEWEKYYGVPPMFYPTHSTSMIVSVTGRACDACFRHGIRGSPSGQPVRTRG